LSEFYYGKQHPWTVANALYGAGTPDGRAWINPLEEKLEASQNSQVVASLEESLRGLERPSHEVVEKGAACF